MISQDGYVLGKEDRKQMRKAKPDLNAVSNLLYRYFICAQEMASDFSPGQEPIDLPPLDQVDVYSVANLKQPLVSLKLPQKESIQEMVFKHQYLKRRFLEVDHLINHHGVNESIF